MTRPRVPRDRPSLPLYITGEQPCPYLPGLSARTLFVDPLAKVNGTLYELLLSQGFRRSGGHIYRPACEPCKRCVPLRLPVQAFRPNRSQRRNRTRNDADVTAIDRPATFEPEHYALYETYVRSRHAGGSMAKGVTPESYYDFLIAPWGGETRLLELRLNECLMAIAVTDRLPASLSAVYTFFDPAFTDRAPGTYTLLRQLDLAREHGLGFLYLGYWIEECRKMSYKDGYRPLEAFIRGQWHLWPRGEPIQWRERGSEPGAPS